MPNTFLYLIIAYSLLIGSFILVTTYKSKIKKMFHSIKEVRDRKLLKRLADETLEQIRRRKEMNEIEEENFKSIGRIQVFLVDSYITHWYLIETVIPEFNKHAQSNDQIPLNLSDKNTRKLILEKAEEYFLASDPLLEVLAESFVTKMHQKLDKK